jgi:small subunit ribosomal protein S2e
MSDAPQEGGDRGGFGRGFGRGGDRGGDRGRGGRRGGDRGRGGRGRGGGRGAKDDKDVWTPCTKLGRLVQAVRFRFL